jgi:hypothetical protein
MPRNPNKTPCQAPRCRAWAMRGGTRCRAHRDDKLGPRGAGAPPGNLNALKHGRHSHPLPQPDLERLAGHVLEQPDDLPFQVGLAAQSLQARVGDPLVTLVALCRLLCQLTDLVATRLYTFELKAILHDLPPELLSKAREMIAGSAPHRSPVEMVRFLRNVKKQLLEQNN